MNITPIFNFKDEIRSKEPNASSLKKVLLSLIKERPPYWVEFYIEALMLEALRQYSVGGNENTVTKMPLKFLYHGPMPNYTPYPVDFYQHKSMPKLTKVVWDNIRRKYAETNVPKVILQAAVCSIGDVAIKSGCSAEQVENFVENHEMFAKILKIYGSENGSEDDDEMEEDSL